MGEGWQISAADLSETLRPALLALSALASAWVLSDALRRRLNRFGAAAWTLATLLLPQAFLPLYLAARLLRRRPEDGARVASRGTRAGDEAAREEGADGEAHPVSVPEAGASGPGAAPPKAARLGLALPLAYLAALLAFGAIYFQFDSRGFDARFARAKRAKLYGRREEAVREYRTALAVRDDAHTRKLLGLELSAAGRHEEALRELSAAEQMGDPDEKLVFQRARSLDALARMEEAAAAYDRFLRSGPCGKTPRDALCDEAEARLRATPRD